MKKYTKEYFQKMGKKGGDKTKDLYGLTHFSKINPKKKAREQAEKEEIEE